MIRRILIAATLAAYLIAVATADASWSGYGTGTAQAKAASVSGGSAPSVAVSGRDASVTWPQATLSDGSPVTGYVVKRFDATTGDEHTVGSGCAGVVTGVTCTESGVAVGSWKYSITPTVGGWRGAEGPQSEAVTVASPNLVFTSSTTLSALPGSLSGSLSNYARGETLSFRLDSASSGQVLSGSATPSIVGDEGSASFVVTVPTGTANGAHTLHVVGSRGSVASASFTVSIDTQAPSVSSAAVAKTEGGIVAFVRQGGSYYVYASVADPGSPSSGVATVTANVSALTSERMAVPLALGSYTLAGVSYNYRTAALTASSPLAPGSYTFSVTATDGAGNAATKGGFAVGVDNTAPVATDVQAANASGSQSGRPDPGDTITLTYGEPLDPESVLVGWSGASTTVTARLVDGGSGADVLQIWNAANNAQLPLGQVSLGRSDVVTANASFRNSTLTHSAGAITMTLGTLSGAVARANGTGAMTWTPPTGVFDRAGNAGTTAAVSETGSADRDF